MYVFDGTQGRSTIRALAEGTSDEASLEPGCSDLDVGPAVGRRFPRTGAKTLLRGTTTVPLSRLDEPLSKVIYNPEAR